MMRVAVIGAGNIGAALGAALADGQKVTVGVRDIDSIRAQSLREKVPNLQMATIPGAVEEAEVVVFAVPGQAMDEVVPLVAAAFRGRIAVDASNRIGSFPMNSVSVIGEHLPSVIYFRAFNSLPADTLRKPRLASGPADLVYCGPDGSERQIVEELISAAGLRPVYVGGLEWLAVVDPLAGLTFALSHRLGSRIGLQVVTG